MNKDDEIGQKLQTCECCPLAFHLPVKRVVVLSAISFLPSLSEDCLQGSHWVLTVQLQSQEGAAWKNRCTGVRPGGGGGLCQECLREWLKKLRGVGQKEHVQTAAVPPYLLGGVCRESLGIRTLLVGCTFLDAIIALGLDHMGGCFSWVTKS